MLQLLNRIFIVFVLLAVSAGILLSLPVIFLPVFDGLEMELVNSMENSPDFVLRGETKRIFSEDSPYLIDYTIRTPPLKSPLAISPMI